MELSETRILELEDKIKEILKENQKLQDSSGKATEKEKRAKGLSFFNSNSDKFHLLNMRNYFPLL